ncbi:hypothetical protein FZC76_16595 [Sutcliffiella horikoshii]|uniref:Uncharacterized protein n=1 Tax=Sutcliffiella horikoshii TaxID=79883 RepID=A0A5D4SY48_9BACI|nr:hypothetical protein FZC76_16595 [Sutcliffiella horikoshii]
METPQALAEEAPAAPLGKRSHLRKSTAVFNPTLKRDSPYDHQVVRTIPFSICMKTPPWGNLPI